MATGKIIDFLFKGKKTRAKNAKGATVLTLAQAAQVEKHLAAHGMHVVGERVVSIKDPWARWVTPASKDVNLTKVNADLLHRLAAVGHHYGRHVTVVSGYRSTTKQKALYALYLSGKGNLAAKPGTSNHEKGEAVDCYIGGVPLGRMPNAHAVLEANKLVLGAAGEAWHVERAEVGTWRA